MRARARSLAPKTKHQQLHNQIPSFVNSSFFFNIKRMSLFVWGKGTHLCYKNVNICIMFDNAPLSLK